MQLTREEFKKDIMGVMGIDEESFDKTLVILPCDDGVYKDIGWVVIPNDPVRIMVHNKLYDESTDKLQGETIASCRRCTPEATKEIAARSKVRQYTN